MTTRITIDTHQSHQSPTTSSLSDSRSNSFDEGSSDESWEGVSSEIDPSDSASRPPTSNTGYRDRSSRSRPPPASRAPTRRHTTTERTNRRPPASRVHRHPVPAPPSSVDPDDFPGYGRGYPAPQPGPYGGRMPLPGYAQSAYSQPGPYAPPFAAPGALTHYGAQGGQKRWRTKSKRPKKHWRRRLQRHRRSWTTGMQRRRRNGQQWRLQENRPRRRQHGKRRWSRRESKP
ncbi:uncharacterized protein K444DRAFT_401010 [Hyaloscypha bicolor E]|uniref:Uncharacterized protein n=1 Tax=Hyaloscypha bicolor E TaxID=1095630 RepID=A0A2J6T9Z4_9HELO|nr:uncharacterized protein K444DRAFT_401010 [Hyaloscypha bicolor E]PMD59812.1 hypothetical protein K444DRAFT_401010 [Hyaloscypha bicolor E]